MSDANAAGCRYAVVRVDRVLLYTDGDGEHYEDIVRNEPLAFVHPCSECKKTRTVGNGVSWCVECAEIAVGKRWCADD